MSLVAGAATLKLLTREAIAELNRRGDALRAHLREWFDGTDTRARITGLGSLFAIHPATPELRRRIFLGLYNQGVLIDPRGVGTLSTGIGEPETARFLDALRALQFLAPAGSSAL
jgi:glutamate-1-semialdehyde aminotransferase